MSIDLTNEELQTVLSACIYTLQMCELAINGDIPTELSGDEIRETVLQTSTVFFKLNNIAVERGMSPESTKVEGKVYDKQKN